jgi:hypothetical protein
MTIEEVKELREKLAADITELINQFQKQTGCSVRAINLNHNHLFTDMHAQQIRTTVDLKVDLDL